MTIKEFAEREEAILGSEFVKARALFRAKWGTWLPGVGYVKEGLVKVKTKGREEELANDLAALRLIALLPPVVNEKG